MHVQSLLFIVSLGASLSGLPASAFAGDEAPSASAPTAAPEAAKSDRDTTKPGGVEIQVPLFVKEGDKVRVDTRTGEYLERVS